LGNQKISLTIGAGVIGEVAVAAAFGGVLAGRTNFRGVGPASGRALDGGIS